jgi:hypothetical protein
MTTNSPQVFFPSYKEAPVRDGWGSLNDFIQIVHGDDLILAAILDDGAATGVFEQVDFVIDSHG